MYVVPYEAVLSNCLFIFSTRAEEKPLGGKNHCVHSAAAI